MAHTTNPLILSDGPGTYSIYEPTADIEGSYKKASVEGSTLYVVYGNEHYGTAQGASTPRALVPGPPNTLCGSKKTVDLGFSAKSAHGYDMSDPQIILFEHANLVGNAKAYRSNQQSLPAFPSGVEGASSLIVCGGKWNLWGKTGFGQPLLKTVNKGDIIESVGDINDLVKSIERVSE